jgi:REP element-mobilizing transposase RayT
VGAEMIDIKQKDSIPKPHPSGWEGTEDQQKSTTNHPQTPPFRVGGNRGPKQKSTTNHPQTPPFRVGRVQRTNKNQQPIIPKPHPSEWGDGEVLITSTNYATMSYVKIWIHAVWGTKNREPILIRDARIKLFQHIKEKGEEKGYYLDFINGYVDHAHCLCLLNADMSISTLMQSIKGESSHWSNQHHLLKEKLMWADEYYAASVSESHIIKVRDYIRNQEEHHRKKTFAEECDEFMTKYGFMKSQG